MLPSHCHFHLPPIWCCPPCCSIHLLTVWDCSPAAVPTCSPASTEASRARRAPSAPWNGLGWSQQCSTSTGELSGAEGGRGVAGGGGTQRPSCSTSRCLRQWGAWGNWGAAAQSPVLKAGSALPFSQMSYSQSLHFTKRERPCHRQMCWWGFQISIRYWISSKDVRKCKVHLKTSVSISVDYFIMVCFHCGSKWSATLHGSFLCCQEQGNISFSLTFQVLHCISEGEHSIKSQSDLTTHKEVTSIIITKS